MRFSNRLTSKPGSDVPSRSIAARRFSNCWPFALVIEPAAMAAWIAVNGPLGSAMFAATALLPATTLLAAAVEPPTAPSI